MSTDGVQSRDATLDANPEGHAHHLDPGAGDRRLSGTGRAACIPPGAGACRLRCHCQSPASSPGRTRADSWPGSTSSVKSRAAGDSSSTTSTARSTSSTSRRRTFTPYLDFNGAAGRPGLFAKFTFERNFAIGLTSFLVRSRLPAQRRLLHHPHGGSGRRGARRCRARPSSPDSTCRATRRRRPSRRQPSAAASIARRC